MRALKLALVVVASAVALVGLGLALLTRYLDSAAFRQSALHAAERTLGAEVRVAEMRVSPFSGVTLRQVTIGNPPGTPGELLRAEALVVRPRLLPLLWRRLEIGEMRLEAPAVSLVRGAEGQWSHERLGTHPAGSAAARAPGGPPPAADADAPPPSGPPDLEVLVPRFVLRDGSVAVTGEGGRPLVALAGIEIGTSVSRRIGGAVRGKGELAIQTVRIADRVEAHDLAGPLRFRGSRLTLAPLRGRMFDGTLSGEVSVQVAAPPRYDVRLEVRDGRAEAFLGALGSRTVAGRLNLRGRVTSREGAATGEGRAEIRDGQLRDLPVLGTLAMALDLPLLRDLRFEEGTVDFALAGETLRTPVVRFVSGDVRILGRGEVALRSGTLAHELTLLVPPAVLRRAPREVRRAFTARADGAMGVDFRVWGPYRSPRTDLQDRVLAGFAESILRKGLRELFR